VGDRDDLVAHTLNNPQIIGAKMLNRRQGFTLIELLIVIVIIGILAAIAIPRFARTREKAYFKSMMSDLHNLQAQQEIYFAVPSNFTYATTTTNLYETYAASQGVTITITAAGTTGWAATASHAALAAAQKCAIFVGTVSTVPSPAQTAGVIECSGEL
jgi:prepilin-type N-terminal cleavage/methylation domain-containing protein